MKSLVIAWSGDVPGFADARLDGRYAVNVVGTGIVTDSGIVPLPDPAGADYLRVAANGPGMACTGQSDGGRAWEWDGTAWHDRGDPYGPHAVIYDASDTLRVLRNDAEGRAAYQTLGGCRYVAADGRIVGVIETNGTVEDGIREWTDCGPFRVGQGQEGGAVVQFHDDGIVRLLQAGDARFITGRSDGSRAVVTVVNDVQHETSIYWASVDELRALPAVTSPPVPIVSIHRPLNFGWFVFGLDPSDAPSNCTLRVVKDATAPLVVVRHDGTLLATYVAGASDSDVDQLEAAIVQRTQLLAGVPVVAYWTRQAQGVRVPARADIVGVEAYRGSDESLDVFEARVRASVARVPSAWLIPQCYSSNTNNSSDLASIPPVIARIARDCPNVGGVLVFSAGDRATGWNDHPDVHQAWRQVFAGVMGVPPVPVTQSPPSPPSPDPIPTPPVVTPPAQPHEDEPMPVPDLTPDQKNEVCDAIGAVAAAAFKTDPASMSQGVRQALDQQVTSVADLMLLAQAREGGATPQAVERAAAAGRLLQGQR